MKEIVLDGKALLQALRSFVGPQIPMSGEIVRLMASTDDATIHITGGTELVSAIEKILHWVGVYVEELP